MILNLQTLWNFSTALKSSWLIWNIIRLWIRILMIYDLLNWRDDLLTKPFRLRRKHIKFLVLVFEDGETKSSDWSQCSSSLAIREKIEFINNFISHKRTERLSHTRNSFRFLLKTIPILLKIIWRSCLSCRIDHWNNVFFLGIENMTTMKTKFIHIVICNQFSQTKESDEKNILFATLLEHERTTKSSQLEIDEESLI